MLLIVKLPQEQVIAAVETQGVIGSIGPTSARGWTTLWSPEAEEPSLVDCGAPYLAIDETAEGLHLDVFLGTGEVIRQAWPYGPNAPISPAEQTEAMAAGLTELFECPDRKRDLVALLGGGPSDPEELAESLDPLLDLPELFEPTPAVAVVAYRGPHKIARFAATIAGPALVHAGAEGWSILVAAGEDETRSSQLAAGVSGAAGRRDPVLLIWRDGLASGWSLWRRGLPVADWSWNARWRFVESDPLGFEAQTVRSLVKAMGAPVNENSLRALLRSQRSNPDPLAELVALLSLPRDLLVSLDNPGQFRAIIGVEHVAKTSAPKAVLQGALGGFDAGTPSRWPSMSTAYAIFTVLAAVFCVAVTILLIAVLATDGAVVDEAGWGRGDWARLAWAAVLSLVLVPTAVVRMRRVRRRQKARGLTKSAGGPLGTTSIWHLRHRERARQQPDEEIVAAYHLSTADHRVLKRVHDPDLDVFDKGVAVLRQNGQVVGHVAAELSTMWSLSRPLTVQDQVWLMVLWSNGDRERHIEDYPPWTIVKEIQVGNLMWDEHDTHRGVYSVEWLPENERSAAWLTLGIAPDDF